MNTTPVMQWLNEPQSWTARGDAITVTSDPKTDFWRKTHYDFTVDNGHFYYQHATGDFVADVKFSAAYNALYDQAGLMVRVDEANWIKCGIEFVDGMQFVSVVVTRDYSDWSVVPLLQAPPAIWLRVNRQGATVEVFYALDATDYTMIRTAHLSSAETTQVGLMCASPQGEGFTATFEGFAIRKIAG
jgi:regulation of enolase protein 1 (concanavalin A-like superfamily)